jgi:hypothetical protein
MLLFECFSIVSLCRFQKKGLSRFNSKDDEKHRSETSEPSVNDNASSSTTASSTPNRMCVSCGQRRAQMKVIDDASGVARLLCTMCAANENIKPPAPKSLPMAPHIRAPATFAAVMLKVDVVVIVE